MLEIPALEKCVHELTKLPGIGPKSAQRMAWHLLKGSANKIESLCQSLLEMKAQVHNCPQCFNYTDQVVCRYCNDSSRNAGIICVVEDPMDIARIESSGVFRGRYHVLQGALAPLDGIHPADLTIKELQARVEGSEVQELILALDADLEGDTTCLYLQKVFKYSKVRLSRLAQGVPIGSDMDYIDYRTIGRAIENRIGMS